MNKREYQPLTIPRISWNKDTLTRTYGELVAQPLEPGFGITLGNALRRILLGGVEGSAVTSVIIKGVNNEFSTLPGVVEDVMQIVLNCKQIIVHNKTGKPGSMRLKVNGDTVVRVADISVDEHLELINKEHILAHVSKGGELDITFNVESGRGYQPAKWPIGTALQEDGRIFVDAMFSPVRKVTYEVEKTRVGRDIDYDKLMMSIQTDGTETPVDVLQYAVSVLRTQFEHFLAAPEIPFNEISATPVEPVVEKPVEQKSTGLQTVPLDLLMKPIDVFELSVRAHNCLLNAGIKRVIDLVNMQEDDVVKIKNFGRKSYEEVREVIKTFGLSFGMNIDEAEVKKMLEQQHGIES